MRQGKAAMDDWTGDAPGARRKITVDDLPPPGSNVLAINQRLLRLALVLLGQPCRSSAAEHVVRRRMDGSQPAEYKGDIFAAFHGSWNRTKRTGYKIVRVLFDHATGKALGEYEDFVIGFVTSRGDVCGRPVGIAVAKDGALLFSEDGNSTIWRVSYTK